MGLGSTKEIGKKSGLPKKVDSLIAYFSFRKQGKALSGDRWVISSQSYTFQSSNENAFFTVPDGTEVELYLLNLNIIEQSVGWGATAQAEIDVIFGLGGNRLFDETLICTEGTGNCLSVDNNELSRSGNLKKINLGIGSIQYSNNNNLPIGRTNCRNYADVELLIKFNGISRDEIKLNDYNMNKNGYQNVIRKFL